MIGAADAKTEFLKRCALVLGDDAVAAIEESMECSGLNGMLDQAKGLYQPAVKRWMEECFVPAQSSSITDRGDRLLEEVIELLQSNDYDRDRIPQLVDYVYERPKGETFQEVGGVMLTLAGYCCVAGLDLTDAGWIELERVNQPPVMLKIRTKHQAKLSLDFDTPLPGNAGALALA